MTKLTSKIVFIIFLILTLLLLWDLIQPEKTARTSAIDKEIIITENISETFTTDFDYGYELSVILLEDKFLSVEKTFNVLLKQEGNIILNKTELLNIDRNNNLVYKRFVADSGDDFELIINGIDKSLIGKKVRIYADVTGGGPSVGIALAKALKPYFWIAFGVLSIITLGIGIYSWRKKPAANKGNRCTTP
ncbi:hypothetical protein [Cellulophaga sp. L1A9]|uniref:hypothetical protein n=1 Tax=Cellulophaga sp. L1A9 TaxID=2686362 RepID=UPI00131E18AB|nr:hypothetical protein [Cellulophaga sp. L1A9]